MSAIYHPGVITVVPHYAIGAPHDAVNVLQWKTTNALGPSALVHIQTAFNTAWGPAWAALGVAGTQYLGSWVIDSSSATGGQVTNTGFTPVNGTASGDPLGDQVAYLISLKGITRFRGGHSRLYIPGVASSKVTGDGRNCTGSATAALVSLYQAAVTAMAGVATVDGGPLLPIIWHKKLASNPNTIEDVISWTGNQVLATQRRRLRKVSRHRRHTGP